MNKKNSYRQVKKKRVAINQLRNAEDRLEQSEKRKESTFTRKMNH
jgi:hypothetical protein